MRNLKLVTAVTTEPITKADAKAHLRLDSETYAGDMTTVQSIVPGSHVVAADYSLEGASGDVSGLRALVNLNAGTCGSGGSVDVKVQESDDDLNWTDWSSFAQVTEANDNAVYEKEYTGSKQYIRAVATVATASCEFSVDIITDSGSTAEDSQLDAWIQAAREYGEDFTGLAFAPQTWDYFLPDFPNKDDYIKWPKGPLTAVTHVKYTDSDGNELTATVNTDYIVDVDTAPGKIFLPYGEVWPVFVPYPYNAVVVRGVCGYTGAAPYIIPHNLRQAMLVHVGLMHKYRDGDVPKTAMNAVHSLYYLNKARWF